MNKFLLPIRLAFGMIRKHRMRSALTVFGIVIGIAMVIVVLSAGEGLKSLVLGEVASFGDDWINIEIKIPSAGKTSQENSSGIARGVSITTLKESDMEAIRKLDNIKDGYAGITTQVVASFETEKKRPSVFGVTPAYIDITKDDIAAGRFFDDSDQQSAANVIVLGDEIKTALFGNQDAVGRTIKVSGKSFRVIGVMEPVGATGFINMDEVVYIPLKTAQKKIMGVQHVLWIIVQTRDNSIAEETAEEIRAIMRDRHDISNPDKDDFSVTTMAEALALVDTIIVGITGLLIVLVMISLVVGGVGIMNVMYVSVAERTFEIGLRKSVGATEAQIKHQFLMEAVILTLFGGGIGIILGALLSYGIAFGAQSAGFAWAFSISIISIVISVSFSALVGLFFGWYPAKKAASLDPIMALRAE